MSVDAKIIDSTGDGYGSKVTERGQIVVAPLEFSKFYPVILVTDNTPLTIIPPVTGKQFVITDIIIYGNKNIGVNGATVTIYESDALDSSIILETILPTEIPKFSSREMNGLNTIVSNGVWVNAITDDDDVYVTIGGYYVNASI